MWSYDIRFQIYHWVDILKWRKFVPFKKKQWYFLLSFKGDEIPSQVCPDEEEDSESDEEEEEEQREEKMSEDESEDEEDSEVLS